MRRKSTALTTTIAGAALAASAAIVIPAWAQQSPQTAASGSVQASPAPASAQAPAATPSASATNSVPTIPQEQAISTSGTGVSRGARYLVRNGLDYVEYQEYDRALKYLREAEARQAELTPAERLAVKQGIENAQRGLREAVGAKSPYATSKKPRRAGGFTVAQSRKQAQAKALAAQAAAAASHSTIDDPDTVPEPKGDPIRLASGTSADNEGANVVQAAVPSPKQAVAPADPAVEMTTAAAAALASGAAESSPPAQLPDINSLPIRTPAQAPVQAVAATPAPAQAETPKPAPAPTKPEGTGNPVDNENAKAAQADLFSPIPSIDLSGIPEVAAASKAATPAAAPTETPAATPAPAVAATPAAAPATTPAQSEPESTAAPTVSAPAPVEAPAAAPAATPAAAPTATSAPASTEAPAPSAPAAETPTTIDTKPSEANAPDVAAPVLTAANAVAPGAAEAKPQEPMAPATPVTQPAPALASPEAKVDAPAPASTATPAPVPIQLETISDPAVTSTPAVKDAPIEAPAPVAAVTAPPAPVVIPDPAAAVPSATTSDPVAVVTSDPTANVPAATTSEPAIAPVAVVTPDPAAVPSTTASEPAKVAKDGAKSDSETTPAAATSTDEGLPPLPNDISLKADVVEPSVTETKPITAAQERATPVPLPGNEPSRSTTPDDDRLPPLPPEAEAATAKPAESTNEPESAPVPASETKAQEPSADPAPVAPASAPVPVGDPVAEPPSASPADASAQPADPSSVEPAPTASPAAAVAEASAPASTTDPAPAHVEVMPLTTGGGIATGLGIPQRANPTSRLNDDMKREVERIARQQEEMSRRRQIQPPVPGGGSRGAASGTDLGPVAGRDGGSDYGTQSQVDISRAPSPAEARPIHAIPVPDDYVPLAPRDWSPQRKYWSAAGTCHMPLYFQDAALERYGHSVEQFLGPAGKYFTYPLDDPTQSTQRNQMLQPVFSVGLFAFQIVALPYNLIMDPPWEAEYDLGYYRPGDQIPTDVYYLPLHGVGPPLKGKSY